MLSEHIQRATPPYDPFAIVLSIIMRYFRFLEAQRLEVDHAVIMTERETGRGAVAYSDGTAAKSVSPQNFDLTFMHWIEGNQRNVVYGSQFQVKLAAFVIAEHLIFIRRRDGVEIETHDLTRKDRIVHERLKFHESMVKGLLDTCYVIRERIQRQLSAVSRLRLLEICHLRLTICRLTASLTNLTIKSAFETPKPARRLQKLLAALQKKPVVTARQ